MPIGDQVDLRAWNDDRKPGLRSGSGADPCRWWSDKPSTKPIGPCPAGGRDEGRISASWRNKDSSYGGWAMPLGSMVASHLALEAIASSGRFIHSEVSMER